MTLDEWKQAIHPKVHGSWNLHSVLPKNMDFFVLLSSTVGIIGNGGQTNYAAGNTYEDALAGYRTSMGQKAVALDLGIVLGEGFVARNEDALNRLAKFEGFRFHHLSEIFAILDYYCNPECRISPVHSQVVTGIPVPAEIRAKGKDVPIRLQSSLFRVMAQVEVESSEMYPSNHGQESVLSAFIRASTAQEGAQIASEALRSKLSRVLGFSKDQADLNQSVASYGVDSLLGLEIKNWLAKETGADLPVFEILGGATFGDIGERVALKSSMRPVGWSV